MKLFIDADSILFKAACTQETNKDTRDVVDAIIHDTIADCWADETYIAIKGKNNFRYNIYDKYKSSRKDKEMDEKLRNRLNAAYFHIIDKWKAVAADGMEADDLVCIWAYEAREQDTDWIIAHIDKDLNQIAGNHYNYNKKNVYFINDEEADMNFCIQLLIGDKGDDIPQLKKGFGIKSAERLLSNTTYDNRIDVVVNEYKRIIGNDWDKRLNLVGNLIYMKRTWDMEELNYEDRYSGKADVGEPNGRDKSDTNEDRKELHSNVSN